jgi:hypothetical protein
MLTREALFVEHKNKVEDFLNYLALESNVAASTQNQAFNALVFLNKKVLESPLENVKAARSRKEARIPVVLTRDEVKQVLSLLDGVPQHHHRCVDISVSDVRHYGNIYNTQVFNSMNLLLPFNTICDFLFQFL